MPLPSTSESQTESRSSDIAPPGAKEIASNKPKKPSPWLLGLIAASSLGLAALAYINSTQTPPQANIAEQTVPVTSETLVARIKANGVTQAGRRINLSPRSEGRIAELFVQEGDRVKAGDLIARMESQRLQAQTDQYRATVNKAEAFLASKLAGSTAEAIREAKARVDSAQASLKESQANFNRAQAERQRYQMLVERQAISRNQYGEYATKEQQARANLEAAQGRLAEQRANLDRVLSGSPKEDIDQAKAGLEEARAQLQLYEIQLEEMKVRAPFAGMITRLYAQKGDFVTPTNSASTSDSGSSAAVAELSSGLEVEAKVPEANITRVKVGQPVEISVDTYPDRVFPGKVRLIAPRAVKESNVTFFKLRVAVLKGQENLKLGMNAKLELIGDRIPNSLAVPLAAIITQSNGQTGVLVPNAQGEAQFRPVTVGMTAGDRVQILSGLIAGERVFITPPPGQKIEGVDTTVGF